MRASCYSDRSPDHHRRRVTPRSSLPVSLAVSRVRAGRRRSCRVSSAAAAAVAVVAPKGGQKSYDIIKIQDVIRKRKIKLLFSQKSRINVEITGQISKKRNFKK